MPKILVIEDNETIREEVLTWLMLEDYEAVGAANGREGVKLALQQVPDLILSDIMMPEKDGYRVLLELRAQPVTALIPFIFLTAKQEKTDIRHGMELGADDYITKPFSREELLNAIQIRLTRREVFIDDSDRKMRSLRYNLMRVLPHELRTPLVGILGVGELLEQDAESLTPAEIIEYAEMITASGRQLYRLVENHLLYAQLEIYASDPHLVGLLNEGAVEEAASILRDTSTTVAQNHGRVHDLHLNIMPSTITIERKHLSKIAQELVDNAFKFSQPHTQVNVEGKVQADKYILTISDQGRGIAQTNLQRIDAYVQFERMTYEQQGSGLGLTLAQHLAELHGGSLKIESTVGLGTVVQVTLPLNRSLT
ncbi:MAG: response regulator [Caldilineaceae bacterium]